MVHVVIHTPTRVVRKAFTEGEYTPESDETVVDLPALDLSPTPANPEGRWKLDLANQLVIATLAEWRAAGRDHDWLSLRRQQRHAALVQIARDIREHNGTVAQALPLLKEFFRRFMRATLDTDADA